ncbi:MAG: VOC family protein [Planctomycetota bacterium]
MNEPALHLRIARPARDPEALAEQYAAGLGFVRQGGFRDHDGFDGAMVGPAGGSYHLEFTRHGSAPVEPSATPEDLLVIYEPDEVRWSTRAAALEAAGFRPEANANPYWDARGRTYRDAEGYRLVLQRAAWNPAPETGD